MFIGHFAAGFAAKRLAPRVSLGTLLLAAAFIDLLWPIFLILGLEHARIDPGNTAFTPLDFNDYPITHSLPGVLLWAVALGGTVHFFPRNGKKGDGLGSALVVGGLVVSHWVLDAIVHRPDLPVLPDVPYVGLGLWNSIAATIVVEGSMFAAGVALYVRSTRARDRIGRWGLAAFVAFLVVAYVTNILAPPPPSARALAYGALVAWLLVPWPYWIDRRRVSSGPASPR